MRITGLLAAAAFLVAPSAFAVTAVDDFIGDDEIYSTELPGMEESLPLIVEANEQGAFVFDISLDDWANALYRGELPLWIDPPFATAYTLTISGSAFTGVAAPSFTTVPDPDGYTLTYGPSTASLASGAIALFGSPITSFTIGGIDYGLADATDPAAFPVGVFFSSYTGTTVVTMTPITAPVPLPAGGALLLAALGALGLRARRG